MSSLLTRNTLGSGAGLSRISCGFALLLRLDDGFAEFVSLLWTKGGAEGSKTRLDGLDPSWEIGDRIGGGVVGADSNTLGGGLSPIQFEGSNCSSIEVVGDAADVFEFIGHSVWSLHLPLPAPLRFKFYQHHKKYLFFCCIVCIMIGPLGRPPGVRSHILLFQPVLEDRFEVIGKFGGIRHALQRSKERLGGFLVMGEHRINHVINDHITVGANIGIMLFQGLMCLFLAKGAKGEEVGGRQGS
jgi:hypothetical protein